MQWGGFGGQHGQAGYYQAGAHSGGGSASMLTPGYNALKSSITSRGTRMLVRPMKAMWEKPHEQ